MGWHNYHALLARLPPLPPADDLVDPTQLLADTLRALDTPPPPLRTRYDVGLDGATPGEQRLMRVLALLDTIPQAMEQLRHRRLPQTQREIARLIVATALPKIVGVDEWIADRRKFLDIMLIRAEWNPQAGVLAARQNGKTWTCAVVAAAIMMTCPGIRILNFCSKLGQAQIMQRYVEAVLRVLHQKPARGSDGEELHLSFSNDAVRSSFRAFSMNAYVPMHARPAPRACPRACSRPLYLIPRAR